MLVVLQLLLQTRAAHIVQQNPTVTVTLSSPLTAGQLAAAREWEKSNANTQAVTASFWSEKAAAVSADSDRTAEDVTCIGFDGTAQDCLPVEYLQGTAPGVVGQQCAISSTLAWTLFGSYDIMGLERIEQEQPEIVITDIRMPVLTGLELVQQVTERFPQTRFVVISGYRYFEYAQKALKYGVEDYLLKPIDEEELNRTLKKICDALQTTAVHRAQMEKYEKNYENSQKLLSRDVMARLKAGDGFAGLPEFNAAAGVEFTGDCFMAVVLRVNSSLLQQASAEEERLVTEKVQANIKKSLGGQMYISCTDGHTTTLLLNFESEAYAKTGEALHACRESCRSYMNNYAHYTVSMGQSERCTEVAQIGALLQQADRAECRKLFEGSGMCLKYQAEERPDAARKAWQNKVRSLLEKGMEPMQRTALQQAVDAIFDSAGAAGLAAWEYFDTAEQCLRDFCAWSLGHGMEIRRDWADSKREKVRSAASVHQLAQWLAATLCAKQEELYAQRVHAEEYPIRLAIEYMKKHYAEKITLEDVAAHSGFNPTYFSEKFKEKTGKNFTDFLTEVRMEAAKELLRDSRKTIGQIGDAVGYKDAKYFSQQFTKCVGMKPTEYRKLYY